MDNSTELQNDAPSVVVSRNHGGEKIEVRGYTYDGEILGTAERRDGGNLLEPVSEQDLVRVQGVQMQVKDAMRLGFLGKDANGAIVETGQKEYVRPGSEVQDTRPSEHALEASEASSEALANWVPALSQEYGKPVAVSALMSMIHMGGVPQEMKDLAIKQKKNLGALEAEAGKVYWDIRKGLEAGLKQRGIDDPDAFYSHMARIKGERYFSNLVAQSLLTGNASAIWEAAASYPFKGTSKGGNEQPMDPVKVRHPSGAVFQTTRGAAANLRKQGYTIVS